MNKIRYKNFENLAEMVRKTTTYFGRREAHCCEE